MTPEFIRGVEHAKTVLRQLSVQAPSNADEARIHSMKTAVMNECVEAACRLLDEDVAHGTIETRL